MKRLRKIVCNCCGNEHLAILKGFYPNRKDKIWVDSKGKQFNGRVCPFCVVVKSQFRKRLGIVGGKRRDEEITDCLYVKVNKAFEN